MKGPWGTTLLERLILDSLAKRPMDVDQLADEVGMDASDLQRVLVALVEKDLVKMDQHNLVVHSPLKDNIESVRWEAKELLAGLTDFCLQRPQSREEVQRPWQLCLSKLELTASQMRMLNVLMHNLHCFLARAQEEAKSGGEKKQKVLVSWGHAPYPEVVKQILHQL